MLNHWVIWLSTFWFKNPVPIGYFESCGFYTYLYAGSVCFMLYLFFYVLRVKYSGVGNGPDDEFDVDDFIRRMTNATGMPHLGCIPLLGRICSMLNLKLSQLQTLMMGFVIIKTGKKIPIILFRYIDCRLWMRNILYDKSAVALLKPDIQSVTGIWT